VKSADLCVSLGRLSAFRWSRQDTSPPPIFRSGMETGDKWAVEASQEAREIDIWLGGMFAYNLAKRSVL